MEGQAVGHVNLGTEAMILWNGWHERAFQGPGEF